MITTRAPSGWYLERSWEGVSEKTELQSQPKTGEKTLIKEQDDQHQNIMGSKEKRDYLRCRDKKTKNEEVSGQMKKDERDPRDRLKLQNIRKKRRKELSQ